MRFRGTGRSGCVSINRDQFYLIPRGARHRSFFGANAQKDETRGQAATKNDDVAAAVPVSVVDTRDILRIVT